MGAPQSYEVYLQGSEEGTYPWGKAVGLAGLSVHLATWADHFPEGRPEATGDHTVPETMTFIP